MPGSTVHSTLHSGRLGMCDPLSTRGRLCWLLLLPGWLLVVVGPLGPSAAPHKTYRHSCSGQQHLPGPFHLQNSLVRFLTLFLWASSSSPAFTTAQRILLQLVCCCGGLLAVPVQVRRLLTPWGVWLSIALLWQLRTCIGRVDRANGAVALADLLLFRHFPAAQLRIANALRSYGLCIFECNECNICIPYAVVFVQGFCRSDQAQTCTPVRYNPHSPLGVNHPKISITLHRQPWKPAPTPTSLLHVDNSSQSLCKA